MHFIVSFYVSCCHLLLPEIRWVTFLKFFIGVVKYSWWLGYYILSGEYYEWPVESWLFQFRGSLRMDVRAICVDVHGLRLWSVESLEFSVLYLLGLSAAFGPFHNSFVVSSLAVWTVRVCFCI